MSLELPVKRNLAWAVKIFRPLMKQLKLQSLDSSCPRKILTSTEKNMFRLHMDRCMIVACRWKFSDSRQGVSIWRYNKNSDVHVLYIFVNDALFDNEVEKLKILRKIVTTHEFTHCVAYILTISRIANSLITEREIERLRKNTHILTKSDIQMILGDILKSPQQFTEKEFLAFPDEHFRTGDEDFQSSYSDLYRNFLLSYELFREFFDDSKMLEFIKATDKNDGSSKKVLEDIITSIAIQKGLSRKFIIIRIQEFVVNIKADLLLINEKIQKQK